MAASCLVPQMSRHKRHTDRDKKSSVMSDMCYAAGQERRKKLV